MPFQTDTSPFMIAAQAAGDLGRQKREQQQTENVQALREENRRDDEFELDERLTRVREQEAISRIADRAEGQLLVQRQTAINKLDNEAQLRIQIDSLGLDPSHPLVQEMKRLLHFEPARFRSLMDDATTDYGDNIHPVSYVVLKRGIKIQIADIQRKIQAAQKQFERVNQEDIDLEPEIQERHDLRMDGFQQELKDEEAILSMTVRPTQMGASFLDDPDAVFDWRAVTKIAERRMQRVAPGSIAMGPMPTARVAAQIVSGQMGFAELSEEEMAALNDNIPDFADISGMIQQETRDETQAVREGEVRRQTMTEHEKNIADATEAGETIVRAEIADGVSIEVVLTDDPQELGKQIFQALISSGLFPDIKTVEDLKAVPASVLNQWKDAVRKVIEAVTSERTNAENVDRQQVSKERGVTVKPEETSKPRKRGLLRRGKRKKP